MFYIYNEKEKKTLGQFFSYLRLNKDIATIDIYKNICSKKVYYEIEKGIPKQNDEYYDQILQRLNLNFYPIDSLSEWLNSYLPLLYHACEYMNQEEIQDLYTDYLQFFKDRKQYFVYEQYDQIFNYLFRYYKDSTYLNSEEIKDVFHLLPIIEEQLQILLIEVVSLSNWNYVGDYKLFDEIFKWCEKYKENVIVMYYRASFCELKLQYIKALNIYEEIEKQSKDNPYRLIRALSGKFSIYKDIDNDKAEETIPLLLNASNDKSLPNRTKKALYYNIGMFYYLHKQYDQAKDYFRMSIKIKKDYANLLMLSSSCSEIGDELPDELDDFEGDMTRYVYVDYFKIKKQKTNEKELESFIMRKVMKELKKECFTEPAWNMFERELARLNKITRNYALLNEYQHLKNKYCKDSYEV